MMIRIARNRQTAKRNNPPRNRNAGFTLIELLVVIAIIALLMGILMPALSKVRKLARSAVCKAHLRQWGTVFYMYTTDNDGKFWVEPNVWATGTAQGGWMPYLSSLYGNLDEFRLCPSANKINGTEGGIGTTFRQWGPGQIMINHQFGEDASKNYGSYGTNLWINSLGPASPHGWRNQPDRQWKTVLSARLPAQVPMVSDCTWFGTNPISIKDASWPNGGEPTPSRDWWENQDPINFGGWGYDMARVCIDRHGRGVNFVFMDGSSRKVFLKNLWGLKWHKEFELIDEIEIPWLN